MLIDVLAAAALLGVSATRVRAFLRSGKLASDKTARGHWRVSTPSVDALLKDRAAAPPEPVALPAADATYFLADAARIAGVNRSYLQQRDLPVGVDPSRDFAVLIVHLDLPSRS